MAVSSCVRSTGGVYRSAPKNAVACHPTRVGVRCNSYISDCSQQVKVAAATFVTATLLCLPSPSTAAEAGFTATTQAELTPLRSADLPPIPTEFPPLPELILPSYQQVTLDNGLRVFLIEDHEVPIIRGTILMRGGQHASPADKVGLASLSAAVQRAGGGTSHPESELNQRLEDLAAEIEAGAGAASVSVDFECMKEDVDEVMGLFADVIRNPVLPESQIALYRAQILNLIEHQYDNQKAVASRELSKLIWGADSIYARQPVAEQVSAITRQDVQEYLQKWERPDSSVIGLVGDFDSQDMRALVEKHLGSWAPAAGQPDAPLPPPNQQLPQPGLSDIEGKVFVVDMPGAQQASVVVGEPGISLRDPDTFPLGLLSNVLNSFGGTLFDQIRSREGLAYSISGGWDTPAEHPGLFSAAADTSRPAELLTQLRSVLNETRTHAPSASEQSQAKSELVNSFVFNFASRPSQLQRILAYDLFKLPQDYLFQYKRGIEAVTGEDVIAAAQRHLHPEKQVTVVVGNASIIVPELEAAGFEVTPLELVPPP